MSDLTTQKTNLLVDKKVKKEDKNALGKSFKSILIDFDVIPYVIGFIIALSFHNLLSKLSNTIIQKVFKIKRKAPLINEAPGILRFYQKVVKF